MTIEKQEQIKIIKDAVAKIEEIEKAELLAVTESKFERWKPKLYEIYFYVHSYGVGRSTCDNSDVFNLRQNGMNTFPTEEAAQLEYDRTTLWRELRQFAIEENKGLAHIEDTKYFHVSKCHNNGYSVDGSLRFSRTALPKFHTLESTQKAIEKFKDRLHLLDL